MEYDTIVVGTGAGGATVARELTLGGQRVLMLEKGHTRQRLLGTHIGAALMINRLGLEFSKERLQVIRGITTGGSTMLTCGTATDPAPFIAEKLGMDLSREVAEAKRDLKVAKLPDELVGLASWKLLEAAGALGYHFEVLEKFIDPNLCRQGCSRCTMGCPTGAKWSARRYVEEAVQHGAELRGGVAVREVTHRDGRATGVIAVQRGRHIHLRADRVVVAAGGLGSAPILLRSGLSEAGDGLFADPLVIVYGRYEGPEKRVGSAYCPPMAVGTWEFYRDQGFMISPLLEPWLVLAAHLAMSRPQYVTEARHFDRLFGLMVKIKDDMSGAMYADGTFSKPLTEDDHRKIDTGVDISEQILIKAGCNPRTIVKTPIMGAHPGGACRIGTVIDEGLETKIKNLFVCDASIWPEALGTPVVLTMVSTGKWLSKRILQKTSDQTPAAAAS